jgi:hypothetical protein
MIEEIEKKHDLPAKLFTAFSPTTMSRLHAICQTPTLTEPAE